jgi:hypothetical protein
MKKRVQIQEFAKAPVAVVESCVRALRVSLARPRTRFDYAMLCFSPASI